MGSNAVIQEGNDPHEDPNKLLKEAFGVLKELRSLIGKINAANVANKLADGRTLTELATPGAPGECRSPV